MGSKEFTVRTLLANQIREHIRVLLEDMDVRLVKGETLNISCGQYDVEVGLMNKCKMKSDKIKELVDALSRYGGSEGQRWLNSHGYRNQY